MVIVRKKSFTILYWILLNTMWDREWDLDERSTQTTSGVPLSCTDPHRSSQNQGPSRLLVAFVALLLPAMSSHCTIKCVIYLRECAVNLRSMNSVGCRLHEFIDYAVVIDPCKRLFLWFQIRPFPIQRPSPFPFVRQKQLLYSILQYEVLGQLDEPTIFGFEHTHTPKTTKQPDDYSCSHCSLRQYSSNIHICTKTCNLIVKWLANSLHIRPTLLLWIEQRKTHKQRRTVLASDLARLVFAIHKGWLRAQC